MPQNVIDMLDHLLENGSDNDIKVLGEGIKCALNMLSDIDEKVDMNCDAIQEHIKDKELHTAKGILVQSHVIAWMVGAMILIASIVSYLPELVSRISGVIP